MNEYSPDPNRDRSEHSGTSEFDELHEFMDEFESRLSTRGMPAEPESSSESRVSVSDQDLHNPAVTHVPRWSKLHLVLFVLTCLSTFYVGMMTGEVPIPPAGTDEITREMWMAMIANGFTYAGAVMAILLAHEMGHYLQARRYHVAASPPYFIPMPFTPLGTMGAVIIQYSGYADRKKLYDIAISGPLAGLVLALPVAWLGIRESVVKEVQAGAMMFGDPLIMQWMYEFVHGPLGENQSVIINPLLFAGWVGIFITGLNLIPVGQLDGGHVLYSLIGKRAHTVAMLVLGGAMAYMVYTSNYAFSLMIVLLLFMGPRHPPTANDHADLGWFRVVLGWLTLAFIIVGFTPNPISIAE